MGEVTEILLNAKDNIAYGWVPRPPRGGIENCSVTAITQAYRYVVPLEGRTRRDAVDIADFLVREVITGSEHQASLISLAEWNDSQTDKQVVIDAFDEAIRLAKQREL